MASTSITNTPRYLNADSDERLLSPEEMSDALNVRGISGEEGKGFVLKTIRGNQLINHTLPTGGNTVIGAIPVEETNKIYYFVSNSVSNSNDEHSILEYDSIANTIQEVIRDSVLNFQTTNLIQGRGMILENGDTLIYFTDNLNPVRKINVQTALSGYPSPLTEEYIEVLKYPPVNKPTFEFDTVTDQSINNVAGKMFQFSYRYIYDDGEVSAYSPYSDVAISDYYLQNSVYTSSQIDSNNNVINLTLDTGSGICTHIEVIFREGNTGEWKRIRRIANNSGVSTLELTFDNNGNYQVADTNDTNKLFDNVPITAKAIDIIGNKLVLGNYVDGYSNVEEVATSTDISIVPRYYQRKDYTNAATIPASIVVSPILGNNVGTITFDFSSYTVNEGDYILLSCSPVLGYIPSTFPPVGEASIGIIQAEYVVQGGDTIADILDAFDTILSNNPTFGDIAVVPYLTYSSGTDLFVTVRPRPDQNVTAVGTPLLNNSIVSQGGGGLSINSFKSGANHPVGIVYYDRGNRSSTVQKPLQEGVYVKFFSEREGDPIEGFGVTGLDMRIGTTPPEWATHYKIVYAGNTTVGEFLQYTSLGAYAAANTDTASVADAKIYLSFRGFKGKADSYKERLGAEIDYNFQEGDRLRIISYYDADAADRVYANGYLDFKILGLETYDPSNSPLIVGTASEAEEYNRTGVFLLVEDSGLDGWSFSDLSGQNNWYDGAGGDNTGNGAYFEIYRPYASPENEVYYEIGQEYSILNAGTVSRTHEGNIRNQGSIISYTITNVNDSTSPTYVDVGLNIDNVNLVNGDEINVSGTGSVARGIIRQTEFLTSSSTRIYFDFESFDGVVNGDVVALNETTAAIRISGGDVWMKPRLLRINNTANTLDNYIDVAEDYYANDFLPTNSWGKGRPNAFSENSKQVNRYQTITWSDSFFTDTNDNGFSSFNTALVNFKEFQNGYGSIQLLRRRGNDLVCYQEDRVSNILVNKDILFTPDGSSTVSISNNFVSEPNYYSGDYGIGLNPESFAEADGRHYWASAKRGNILRLGGDGITPISEYGMRSYFDGVFSSFLPSIATAKIFSGFDRDNQEYYVSIPTGIDTITICFSEQAKKWISRWSFKPEFYSGVNMKFITFDEGKLYLHDANSLHSNFYGVQYNASFSITANANPQVIKTYRACELQSNKAWDCTVVQTNLVSSSIPEANFEEKEGFYHAEFLRTTGGSSGNKEAPFVGLGTVSAINGNVVTISGFNKSSVDVMIGDVFYQSGSSAAIGTVTAIGDGELVLSSVLGLSVNDFVYLIKDLAIQGDAIKGYYAKMTFTQDDSSYSEIFAVRNFVNYSPISIK